MPLSIAKLPKYTLWDMFIQFDGNKVLNNMSIIWNLLDLTLLTVIVDSSYLIIGDVDEDKSLSIHVDCHLLWSIDCARRTQISGLMPVVDLTMRPWLYWWYSVLPQIINSIYLPFWLMEKSQWPKWFPKDCHGREYGVKVSPTCFKTCAERPLFSDNYRFYEWNILWAWRITLYNKLFHCSSLNLTLHLSCRKTMNSHMI